MEQAPPIAAFRPSRAVEPVDDEFVDEDDDSWDEDDDSWDEDGEEDEDSEDEDSWSDESGDESDETVITHDDEEELLYALPEELVIQCVNCREEIRASSDELDADTPCPHCGKPVAHQVGEQPNAPGGGAGQPLYIGTIGCPQCRLRFQAPVHLAGRRTNCPQCGANMFIPDPTSTLRPDLGELPAAPATGLAEEAPPSPAAQLYQRRKRYREEQGPLAVTIGLVSLMHGLINSVILAIAAIALNALLAKYASFDIGALLAADLVILTMMGAFLMAGIGLFFGWRFGPDVAAAAAGTHALLTGVAVIWLMVNGMKIFAFARPMFSESMANRVAMDAVLYAGLWLGLDVLMPLIILVLYSINRSMSGR